MFELWVIASLALINWLPPNFSAKNDLIFVFHQTLTLALPLILLTYYIVHKPSSIVIIISYNTKRINICWKNTLAIKGRCGSSECTWWKWNPRRLPRNDSTLFYFILLMLYIPFHLNKYFVNTLPVQPFLIPSLLRWF